MAARRLAAVAAVLSFSFTMAACSFSYKLDSLFGSDKEPEPGEYTGSAHPAAATGQVAALADADLALAKAAISEAVTRTGRDVSVPWENPATGARGTITPLAPAFAQNGVLCRDFLASYVRETSEAWLQGEACRVDDDRWEVRNLKPWKRS